MCPLDIIFFLCPPQQDTLLPLARGYLDRWVVVYDFPSLGTTSDLVQDFSMTDWLAVASCSLQFSSLQCGLLSFLQCRLDEKTMNK